MTDKQKEAIEYFKECILKDHLFEEDLTLYFMKIVLNIIQTQQAEIEKKEKEKQIHIKLEQQYKKEYLDTKEELEKKDKIIDEMTKEIYRLFYIVAQNIGGYTANDYSDGEDTTEEEIKRYFEKKVETEDK